MRSRRPRNLGTEKSVAGMQAGVLGVPAEDLLKAIDARDGDYYQAGLHPQGDAAYDALKNFGFGGHNNPLIPELKADMQRFYGLQTKAAAPASPANAPLQGPEPPPAQAFKDAKVETVKETNPRAVEAIKEELIENDYINTQQLVQPEIKLDLDKPNDMDTLLLAAGLLGAGGLGAGVGRATAPEEEDDDNLMIRYT
jgi:hypothetical protein